MEGRGVGKGGLCYFQGLFSCFVLFLFFCMPQRCSYANSRDYQFYNYFPNRVLKNLPAFIDNCVVLMNLYKVNH